MEYNIIVRVVVNDQNPHSPTLEDCVMVIENALLTPDNHHFGVEIVEVKPASDLSPVVECTSDCFDNYCPIHGIRQVKHDA